MNPYLYCTPNDISDSSAKEFEKKVIALSPQHVRIFFMPHWLTGDRRDPVAKDDRRVGESFLRTCRLAQRAGATINLTHWYGPWKDPENQMAELARLLARIVRDEKITGVRYVTIQNEVNEGDDKVSPQTYDRLYLSLDAELRKLKLREQIQIVCGDLVSTNQRQWLTHIGSSLSRVSDGYSIHAYWDYWDTPKLQRRLRESREMLDALPPAQRRPMYVTEFGVRGHREQRKVEPGNYEDGTPLASTPLQANQLAWFTLEALNRGYVATVIWTMEDAWYDRLMPYGVIGAAADNWPIKPGYHVLRLFTHTCQPGWHALKVDGESDSATVAAVTSADRSHLTVYGLNHADKPATLTLAGLPRGVSLRALMWNGDGQGTLAHAAPAAPAITPTGEASLTLRPLSLIALTTEPFDP